MLLQPSMGSNASSTPAPAQEQQPLADRALHYVKSHPYLTTLHTSSAPLSAFSFDGPLLLSLAGFSATGPATGTLAAVWQSSMGAVQVRSLFVRCQSAAMGAVAAGISAAGLVGSGVASVAGVVGLLGGLSREAGVDVDVLGELWNGIRWYFGRGWWEGEMRTERVKRKR